MFATRALPLPCTLPGFLIYSPGQVPQGRGGCAPQDERGAQGQDRGGDAGAAEADLGLRGGQAGTDEPPAPQKNL